MRKIDPEERVMQYFMTASEEDIKRALQKAQLICQVRDMAKKPGAVEKFNSYKPRTKRDKPQADLELRETHARE